MIQRFENREAASLAAANLLAAALRNRLLQAGDAGLVISGGNTPQRCYQLLGEMDLPWHRVRVTLTDERLVDASDAQSNERMVRESLMAGRASAARFLPLTEQIFSDLPLPTAATLVGMGEDGHFASLFPDLQEAASRLDPAAAPAAFRLQTSGSPLPRISMNLAALLESDTIVLLAYGGKKWEILEKPHGFPIEALVAQQRRAVTVLWAP